MLNHHFRFGIGERIISKEKLEPQRVSEIIRFCYVSASDVFTVRLYQAHPQRKPKKPKRVYELRCEDSSNREGLEAL